MDIANCKGASRLTHMVRTFVSDDQYNLLGIMDLIGRGADVRTGDNAAAGRGHDRGRVPGDGDGARGSSTGAGDGTEGRGEPAASGPRIRQGQEI